MTLSEFAKKHNIARQNLYPKIKAAGIDLKEIRDQRGNLTNEGIDKLEAMLSVTNTTHSVMGQTLAKQNDKLKCAEDMIAQKTAEADQALAKQKEAQQELASVKAEAQAALARVKELLEMKTFLEGQLAAIQQDKARAEANHNIALTALKEAMDQQNNVIRLMSGDMPGRKLTWRERFTGHTSVEKKPKKNDPQ